MNVPAIATREAFGVSPYAMSKAIARVRELAGRANFPDLKPSPWPNGSASSARRLRGARWRT